MRRLRPTLLLTVVAAAGMFTFAGASSASPSGAGAISQPSGGVTVLAPSCTDFWLHSGHTANVRWFHCHGISTNVSRVHICGFSGTLHGITVALSSGGWVTRDHAHDPGGEGC